MKKSELIQAIKEALLPEIEKIVKKRVTLAAAQIIKENRKAVKPTAKEQTTSLTSLMNEQPTSNPYEVQGKQKGYEKQTFIKGNEMLNDMLNETAQQAQEYKSMGGADYTSDMAKNFKAANPMSAFGNGKPTVDNMIPDDRRGRDIPDAVASALTKDYSKLVKSDAFNKRTK